MFSTYGSNALAVSSGSTPPRSANMSHGSVRCSTAGDLPLTVAAMVTRDAPGHRAGEPAPAVPPGATGREVPAWVLSGAVIAGGLLAWQLLVRALGVPIVLVPAPTDVGRALVAGLADGSLPAQTWVTLREILAGFGLASVSGLIVALLVTQLRLAEKALMPLIVLTQSVPKVA